MDMHQEVVPLEKMRELRLKYLQRTNPAAAVIQPADPAAAVVTPADAAAAVVQTADPAAAVVQPAHHAAAVIPSGIRENLEVVSSSFVSAPMVSSSAQPVFICLPLNCDLGGLLSSIMRSSRSTSSTFSSRGESDLFAQAPDLSFRAESASAPASTEVPSTNTPASTARTAEMDSASHSIDPVPLSDHVEHSSISGPETSMPSSSSGSTARATNQRADSPWWRPSSPTALPSTGGSEKTPLWEYSRPSASTSSSGAVELPASSSTWRVPDERSYKCRPETSKPSSSGCTSRATDQRADSPWWRPSSPNASALSPTTDEDRNAFRSAQDTTWRTREMHLTAEDFVWVSDSDDENSASATVTTNVLAENEDDNGVAYFVQTPQGMVPKPVRDFKKKLNPSSGTKRPVPAAEPNNSEEEDDFGLLPKKRKSSLSSSGTKWSVPAAEPNNSEEEDDLDVLPKNRKRSLPNSGSKRSVPAADPNNSEQEDDSDMECKKSKRSLQPKKRGRPKGSKNKAKQTTSSKAAAEADDSEGCATLKCHICKTGTGKMVVTTCGHIFHKTCLEQWLIVSSQQHRKEKKCPYCCSSFSTYVNFFG
ncbi:Postreplication repair E3 ubiquitin-protein ligase RAD18 [Frankliniella fusca]|uniref:Postreplication repair E3 ubiquitin-protein ligase RAD18 n=1 Tax=Frankliniella fusca TaxID=407009 RepID=A0AAE1LM70_9NEOP|nr:Postreplication repair E3 ubiquitin-protein ligase RAD18 [Frankliniella fusca]KAK3910869.1 Postreplication repair E3 ubiquitin-protein ligase RAD18 [Frankliniella fusca]KAK3924560.1 Postreplication repair E3 ubiquitin-protein ligase RAD18 [Frankliniella fusca]